MNLVHNRLTQAVKFASCSVIAVLAVSLVPLAVAQDDQQPDQDGTAGALEEVVVTAMRRGEQVLTDIPASVSAFSGADLEQRGQYDLRDFLQMAPGVSMVNVAGSTRVQIRGISSSVGSPTVGYYIDESPFSFVSLNYTPDSRVFDMDRVEVLRGPQGTLYGQGSIAGVIRQITNNPDLNEADFAADVSTSNTKDGGWNQMYNAAVSVPLIEDQLAIRFTGTYEDWDGWIDGNAGMGFDLFGVPITFDSGSDKNTEEYKSGRVKVLWTPSEDLTVTALHWLSDTANGARNQGDDDRTVNLGIPQPLDSEYQYTYLTLEYDAEHFTLLSNTSYTEAENADHTELFGTDVDSRYATDGWSQEIRLNSTGDGPWFWTVGGLYQKLDQSIENILDPRILAAFGLNNVDQTDDTTNWAVFGDVTYEFNEQWNVSVGGRYFEDTRESTDNVGGGVVEQDFDDFSPRVNIAYHPSDSSTVFFQVAKGFRSGLNQYALTLDMAPVFGLQVPESAAPEELWTYELGYKAELADGKLFLEAAVFLNDWTDLQQSGAVVQGLLNAVFTAGEAESPGAELGLQYSPNERLSFGGNVSWNDAKYSEDITIQQFDPATFGTVPVVLFPKDGRIAGVPERTANAWIDYTWSSGFGNGEWEGYFHADAQYRDEVLSIAGGTFQSSDDSLTVAARVGIDNGRWGIYLYGTNITDEDGAYLPAFAPNPPNRLRPQTFGINVKFRF